MLQAREKEQEAFFTQRRDRYAGRSNLLEAMRSAKSLPLVTIVCDPDHGRSERPVRFSEKLGGSKMEKPSLVAAIGKLAIAGEQAGFNLEHMIELLDQGLSVETLLDLISWRLEALRRPTVPPPCSSGWIM